MSRMAMIDRCPRCCRHLADADILHPDVKNRSRKCTDQTPCVWRKDNDAKLNDRDMTVMMVDRLTVWWHHMDSHLVALLDDLNMTLPLRHRITDPLRDDLVQADMWFVLEELSSRLKARAGAVAAIARGRKKPPKGTTANRG